VAVAILPSAFGQTHATAQVQKQFAQAADKVFKEGIQAKLPPHISTLLGLSTEAECPVMQKVVRTGNVVEGFDVSVDKKEDVVLFVVDETANDQTLYLTSPKGNLRKVVSVKAGVGAEARITNQDKDAFEKAKQSWVDRLALSHAPK
jgi:hypothetical protein